MTLEARRERADRLGLLAERGKAGDHRAIEALLAELRDDVYRLALRMTGHIEDAEDATQEVLVKVLTRLSMWRGEARITTWVHRVTVNHLLDRPRSRMEQLEVSFDAFGEDLAQGLDHKADASDPAAAMLAEEVRLGCTMAMLQCLDRDHRVAYILGELFELAGEDAAWICDVAHETYRKRLSRARERVRTFMGEYCGLVSDRAQCRCAKRVKPAVACGRVDPTNLALSVHRVTRVGELRRLADTIEDLRDSAAVMRCHPDYAAPERLGLALRELVERSGLAGEP